MIILSGRITPIRLLPSPPRPTRKSIAFLPLHTASINGLAAIIQQNFRLDVFSGSLFLFCGKRCDRIKALLWEEDGFVLLYKRLENGKYKWPRDSDEARQITQQEFRWLMEGLSIEQKTAIRPAKTGAVC